MISSLCYGIRIFKREVSEKKLTIRKYLGRNIKLNENNSIKGYIVNLTTYPKRLNTVHLAIESILQNSIKPEKIILWVSCEEIADIDINKNLLDQKSRGLEIRVVKGNCKSYKKLIYALQEFPSYYLLTIDDDIIYPRYWFKKLYLQSIQYPKTILCYHAKTIEFDSRGNLLPYKKWSYELMEDQSSLNIFPIGCSGILYPPGSLNKEVINQNTFSNLCPTGDDIWFKTMSLLNNIPCKRITKRSLHFDKIRKTQEGSLHSVNNYVSNLEEKTQTDIQIDKTFKEYNVLEKLNKINERRSSNDKPFTAKGKS